MRFPFTGVIPVDKPIGVTSPEGPSSRLEHRRILEEGVCVMTSSASPLEGRSAEEIQVSKRWIETWRRADAALQAVRHRELRDLDGRQGIALLVGPADYHAEPRLARASSGLVEQQRWFMKARKRD
jgi:hypothetical protein